MENLLQLSKLERSDELPPPRPVQVAVIINQVIADLAPLAKQKQQTLTVEPAATSIRRWPCRCSCAKRSATWSATRSSTRPRAAISRVWAERGRRRHTIVLGVRDTGIGLSDEDQARLFTKFFRSSDPRVQRERGTGLGLALTHALVTRMGGTITVESELARARPSASPCPPARGKFQALFASPSSPRCRSSQPHF